MLKRKERFAKFKSKKFSHCLKEYACYLLQIYEKNKSEEFFKVIPNSNMEESVKINIDTSEKKKVAFLIIILK